MLPDWPTAWGDPLFNGSIRHLPGDFRVCESLSFPLAEDGEHDCLFVRKTCANTMWVAEQLAGHAGIRPLDVGFCGLKDRHAITEQWFSVRRPSAAGTDWQAFSAAGVELLEHRRHDRKLRRGAHAANHFKIVVRGVAGSASDSNVEARVATIRAEGVPHYFGEQRFGRGGSNIALGRRVLAGRRVSRAKRSIALSALRSLIFNNILAHRVQTASWNRILAGERANLAGSHSVFDVEVVDDEIVRRCAELDIHPTGTLWGDGAPLASGEVAALERSVAKTKDALAHGLEQARLGAQSRALRLAVTDLEWGRNEDTMTFRFSLPPGAYATSVLRELGSCEDVAAHQARADH